MKISTKGRYAPVSYTHLDVYKRQDLEDGTDVSYSLDELAELTETAGGIVVGRLIQKRESVHPGTYVGKGKIEELRELIMQTDADGIVCDDELTPAQLTNLQEELQVKVLDRTVMILDIFAAHARTSEGKLQVELAQLRYLSLIHIFTADAGSEEAFFVLEKADIAGVSYLLVTDSVEDEEAEAMILREETEDELVTYQVVDDEKELKIISKYLEELLDDVELRLE